METAENIRKLQQGYHENKTNEVVNEIINRIKEQIKTSIKTEITIGDNCDSLKYKIDDFVISKLNNLGFKIQKHEGKHYYETYLYYTVSW